MSQEFAAGASAARNNLANFLTGRGFRVETSRYGYPPTNEDFLASVSDVLEAIPSPDQIAMVIFHWWQSTYEFIVPTSVIKMLAKDPESRYDLFSATTDDRYRPNRFKHTFYLAANDEGEVVVHHERRWEKRCGAEDTTIVLVDGRD